jgi:hypothetical protein
MNLLAHNSSVTKLYLYDDWLYIGPAEAKLIAQLLLNNTHILEICLERQFLDNTSRIIHNMNLLDSAAVAKVKQERRLSFLINGW